MANPTGGGFRFASTGTHLERYARLLRCAEINSSFHRPHAAATYAKWRDRTPPDFSFALKMPSTITHDLKLQDARELFMTFLAQTEVLPRVATLLDEYGIPRVAADPPRCRKQAFPRVGRRRLFGTAHGNQINTFRQSTKSHTGRAGEARAPGDGIQ